MSASSSDQLGGCIVIASPVRIPIELAPVVKLVLVSLEFEYSIRTSSNSALILSASGNRALVLPRLNESGGLVATYYFKYYLIGITS